MHGLWHLVCGPMNTHSQVVATARLHRRGNGKKVLTMFGNGQVVLHHPRAQLKKCKGKRKVHRGMARALATAGVGMRCKHCWTDRKWSNALRSPVALNRAAARPQEPKSNGLEKWIK